LKKKPAKPRITPESLVLKAVNTKRRSAILNGVADKSLSHAEALLQLIEGVEDYKQSLKIGAKIDRKRGYITPQAALQAYRILGGTEVAPVVTEQGTRVKSRA
jgi:hypothetical protein